MYYAGPAMRHLDIFHGEPIRWFRSMGKCPCFNEIDGEWDRTHTLCSGTGVLKEEVDVACFKAIVTPVSAARVYTGIGELIVGDLLCATWPQEIPLSHDDEVIVPARLRTETRVLTRTGEGEADPFPLGEVTEILRVFDSTGAIDYGWSLSQNSVVWQANMGPGEGERYSVSFRYTPRWVVILEAVTMRRPDPYGAEIPQKVGLKLLTPARPGG